MGGVIAGAVIYMIHDRSRLNDPSEKAFQPLCLATLISLWNENGVLYLNPGSAGPRRFNLPVTLAQLKIEAGRMEPEIIHLKS